jgi:hypothetical protein
MLSRNSPILTNRTGLERLVTVRTIGLVRSVRVVTQPQGGATEKSSANSAQGSERRRLVLT